MSSDLEIENMQDFDMAEVDDMPKYLEEIDGVYACKLNLQRDAGTRNDKPYDNIVMNFEIVEEIEAKKNHGIEPEDLVSIRFSTIKTKKDEEEKRRESVGLRYAKPYLLALKEALETSSSLTDIIANSQDVACTVTFATRITKGKDEEGNERIYKNPTIKKFIVS